MSRQDGAGYRDERTTGRAYDRRDQHGEERAYASDGASPAPRAPLWPPDEPTAPTALPTEVAAPNAPAAISELETARIPAPTAITEAETVRIPAPATLSEQETDRIPAPGARPSAGPLTSGAATLVPATPTNTPTPGVAMGLADLPTARMPTAPPAFMPVAPASPALPPMEAIWDAPTAPLAPHSRLTTPPALTPQSHLTAPPTLEPTQERASRWGTTGAPQWTTPASPEAPAASAPAPVAQATSITPNATTPTTPPRRRPTAAPPATPPESPPTSAPAPRRRTPGIGMRVMVIALLAAIALAVGGVGVAYFYGVQQASAPQRAISAYCDALRQANYTAAYALLTPTAQARIPRQQYVSDEQARDAFYGRVTICLARLVGEDGRFIFWRQPSLAVFSLTLDRAGVAGAHNASFSATGRVALAPNGANWLISSVGASLLGIDLDPLTTVSDFCQALIARNYARAYGDLSAPFQHEQGSASGFAKMFGASAHVTGCAERLSSYRVDADDRSATLALTLGVTGALPGGSTTVSFSLPATMKLVRTAQGWRIDELTLGAPTTQG